MLSDEGGMAKIGRMIIEAAMRMFALRCQADNNEWV